MESTESKEESAALPSQSVAARSLDEWVRDLMASTEVDVFEAIYRRVRDCQVAEDLTLETFFRVSQARDRFDPTKDARAWVMRIARNLAIDHWRKNEKKPKPQSLHDGHNELVDKSTVDPLDRVSKGELLANVERIVQGRDEDDRVLYRLRCMDLSFGEIAEQTGRTKAAVTAAWQRLCETLRCAVGPQ